MSGPEIVHVEKRIIAGQVKLMREEAAKIIKDSFVLEKRAEAMRLAACGVKIAADKLEESIT